MSVTVHQSDRQKHLNCFLQNHGSNTIVQPPSYIVLFSNVYWSLKKSLKLSLEPKRQSFRQLGPSPRMGTT